MQEGENIEDISLFYQNFYDKVKSIRKIHYAIITLKAVQQDKR